MKQIKLNLNNQNQIKLTLEATSKILKSGGVIIYPTDTIYGIGANAFDEEAIDKIKKIKSRDKEKPLSVFVKDIKSARRIACIDLKVEKILESIWPGPVTVVLRKKDVAPYSLTGNRETIAVRIPKNEFVLKLLEKVDFPIIATSANISGEKNLFNSDEIIKQFSKMRINPDLFINSGNIQNTLASTIIDLTSNIPKIIRMGLVGKENMKNFFNKFNIN
ncbi:MAG: threonylcarbamoyl-AMP synthase [Candidatus Pacebacteria bacterium]|nr:threonylcarbamoyl-AMP synthase [Candidatus Paceibacterota bacterium]